jgi:hypothetical protein
MGIVSVNTSITAWADTGDPVRTLEVRVTNMHACRFSICGVSFVPQKATAREKRKTRRKKHITVKLLLFFLLKTKRRGGK